MPDTSIWTLRAAHRLDCRERCIDCRLLVEDIEERQVEKCDTLAAAMGAELQAERDRRERELKFQEKVA